MVLSKTYVVSSTTKEGPYKKENADTDFRIIKRIYKCKNAGDLRRIIEMRCAPGKSAIRHLSFEGVDKYAIISYKFENEGCMIEPSKKSRLYPSVREQLKRKIEQRKPPKKVTHEVLKKRAGITNAPSAILIPTINQSYEIARQKYKATSDPLKKLIEKQQRDGTTEDTVIQRVQTNPFAYDIVLFNQRTFVVQIIEILSLY